ncbi:hypothetical protein [Dictyobacter aurantiacus]|uniref:3-keto-disaccharide hydrolase domain-containing protein n=1 Tax=Dictyobacter aurantiacus TaxID=1936993 RepID=A0A401ZB35_9CHLR|nr:hypothetical protein [Dictyobacter aurantiacus]GCE04069.1 hypothetical protein KDAU_13980 [Dictyobacter aurantiacus]
MNNQQGPFNSPFFPKAGERDTEPSENTKTTNQHGSLRHKTSLRGLQQNTGPVPANNAQQPFAPSQSSWGTNGGPQSFRPQQPWSNPGPAFQENQQQQHGAGMQGFPSSPAQSGNPTNGRTPTGQLGPGASMFNNPLFPKGNTQQLGSAGSSVNNFNDLQTEAHTPVNGAPNATQNFGNSGAFRRPTGALGNSGTFRNPTGALGNSGTFRNPTGALGSSGVHPNPNATRDLGNMGLVPSPTGALGNTGTLMHPAGEYSGDTGMLKLNQAVKVVRIPVAGKPGEYKTGILPVLSQGNTGALPPTQNPAEGSKKKGKIMMLAILVMLVIFASGIYMFTRSGGSNMAANPGSTANGNNAQNQANLKATATANVEATTTFNNLIFADPLETNGRGWLTTNNRPDLVKKGIVMNFTDNAYHISSAKVGDNTYFASSVLRNEDIPTRYTYSVDMQQLKGKDDNDFNFFGLLFSYTEIGGQPISYAFRVINNKGGLRYEFCTLDGRKTPVWSDPIWKQNAGKEFKGTKAKNNLKVHVDGHDFTFWVNGKQVGKAHDTSYGTGSIGLGVNGQAGGSEVAFTNLVLSKN